MPITDPTDLTTLVLWLDGSDSANFTLDAGNGISQWNDLSDQANHVTQATTTLRPTLVTTVINQLSAPLFDPASTQYLDLSSAVVSAAGFTIFAVVQKDNANSSQAIIDIRNSGSTSHGYAMGLAGTDVHMAWSAQAGGGSASSDTVGVGYGSTHVVEAREESTTSRYCRVDDFEGPESTGSRNPSGENTTTVGRIISGGGLNYWGGYICELVVYRNTLSDVQRQDVRDYLSNKWINQDWSPLNLAACSGWYDGDDNTTFTLDAGNGVSQWNDKSGLDSHLTQAATISRPTFVANSVNGRSSPEFDATADGGEGTPMHTGQAFLDQPFTVFVVGQTDDNQNAKTLWWNGINNTNYHVTAIGTVFIGANTPGAAYVIAASGSTSQAAVDAPAVDTPFWLTIVGSAASYREIESSDGNSDSNTTTRNPTDATTFTVGRYGLAHTTARPWNGPISEILVYTRVLQASEITSVQAYLQAKWIDVAVLDAEGNAYVTADAIRRRAGTLDAEGNAYTFGRPRLPSIGDVEGSAYVTAEGRIRVAAQLDAEGDAYASADLTQVIRASVEGNAYANADARIRVFGSLDAEGDAYATDIKAEVFRPIVNLPHSDDYVNIGSQSIFQFRVNGSLVNLDSTNKFMLQDITVTYDGAEISFTEIASPYMGNPTYDPDQAVQLDIDFQDGQGLVRVFTGKIRTRSHIGRNNNEGLEYRAFSTQHLANEITALNTTGYPDWEFTVGTTVIGSDSVTGTEIVTTYAVLLSAAINDVITYNTSALANESIPATIGVPGLEQFTISLPETVKISNTNFVDTLQQLASYQGGVKVFFNEKQQKWTFPNLYDLTTNIAYVNSVQLTEAIFEMSILDRYTAVRLISNQSGLNDSIANERNAIPIQRISVTLEEGWRQDIEPAWTLFAALGESPEQGYQTLVTSQGIEQLNDIPPGDWYDVHKVWKIPNSSPKPIFGFPIRAKAKWTAPNSITYWRTINGKVNWSKKQFVARDWSFKPKTNPWMGWNSRAWDEVRLTYYPQTGISVITTITTNGTLTYVVTIQNAEDFIEEVRMPNSGFEGTAYTDFGLEREYVQMVDPTEVNTENAQDILDQYKNVVVEGTLPFAGDIIKSGLWLTEQMVLRDGSRMTGIETTPGIIVQYTHIFGRPGRTDLALSTQVGGIVGNK